MKLEDKVKTTVGKIPIPMKIVTNRKVQGAITSHSTIMGYPVDDTIYGSDIDALEAHYVAHIKGKPEDTQKMYDAEAVVDNDYALTAKFIEGKAFTTKNRSLVLEFALEFFAERKHSPKQITISDGADAGEILVDFPKLENSGAYLAEITEVVVGQADDWFRAKCCTITFMDIKGLQADTKYKLRLCGIFSSGEGPFCNPIPFRTAEAE